jgi:proton-coupled amino acid transporter
VAWGYSGTARFDICDLPFMPTSPVLGFGESYCFRSDAHVCHKFHSGFSLIADAANVFAYGVVFFFDFDRLHDVGASGQIVNFSGFAFFVSVAV